MTCYDAQLIERLTTFQLDDCGRIPTDGENPTPALKGLEDSIQTLARARQVDQPPDNRTKVVSGKTCQKPLPAPTDRGWQYTFTWCGQNPVFEAQIGYKTLDLDGSDIVGWEDREIAGTNLVAVEIVFKPSADACEIGEAAQCTAVLVPALEQWIISGDQVNDGEQVSDLVAQAQTKASRNLFGNYANAGELPDYLSHWAPKFDAIASGRAWSYSRLIDCPAETEENPCMFVAIDSAS